MNRQDADLNLQLVSDLAQRALDEHGATRRSTCLTMVQLAVETLAWAGRETQTRVGDRDVTAPEVR